VKVGEVNVPKHMVT